MERYVGGSGSQRHHEGAGFLEMHWSPHLDIAGSRTGGWGPDGKPPPFPQPGMRMMKRSREGDGKSHVGNPVCVRTPPCELRALISGLAAESFPRLTGASAPLASLCGLREAPVPGTGVEPGLAGGGTCRLSAPQSQISPT